MFEVDQQDLRKRIIERIVDMKDGNEKTTPQPDAARYALRHYHDMLPHFDLMAGVKEALQ